VIDAVKVLQNRAVTQLENQLKTKDTITFKAPTGSGKTHMMGDLMNRVLAGRDDVIFLVSSLSKGGLAAQNYNNFAEYAEGEFPNLNPYLINSEVSTEEKLFIPDDYNVYVLPRDLYKETSRLNNGAMTDFLFTVNFTKVKQIYLIKDECHIATNKLDELGEYFAKVINLSATPKLARRQIPDVEITEKEAIEACLIKDVVFRDSNDSVDAAFERLLEVQKQYIDNDFNMRPCCIVQISNKDKAVEEIAKLKRLLHRKYSDLHWCIIMDKDKDCETNDKILNKLPAAKWKDEVKKKESTVDVIIFKMVITEGWDIPRACILYQIRDSQSKQLDEQVMGRVRRNPMLLTFDKITDTAKDVATKAYIWGIHDETFRTPHEVKLVGQEAENVIQQEIKVKTTKLKEITEINTFDVEKFLNTKATAHVDKSIFEVYKNKNKITEEVQKLYDNYVTGMDSWLLFMNNVDALEQEVKDIETDYAKSMELAKGEDGFLEEFTLPYRTYFVDEGNYRDIERWIWERTDGNNQFSFDSAAEAEWYDILFSLHDEELDNDDDKNVLDKFKAGTKKIYLLGKNFYSNSQIAYQYYLRGIHSSFPDFILKDSRGRIHMFEVKSVDGHGVGVDKKQYDDKIVAICEGYQAASKLTDYYFYVPLKNNDGWDIYMYHDGKETSFTKDKFKKFMKK